MNRLNYEILSAIDNIDSTIMESEMNVMSSIINTYEKSLMILEHCDDNSDVSSYDIFQEGIGSKIGNAIDKLDDKMKAKPNENIIKKILLFIPRLLMKFVQFIRRIVSKSKPLSQETINKAKQSVGDDIIVEYSGYYQTFKKYQSAFNAMKSLININDLIDIGDSHDMKKYDDIKSKLDAKLQFYEHPTTHKSTYAEYLKYYNDTMKIINDMVSSMNEFIDKLEKQINSEVDKIKALEAMDNHEYDIEMTTMVSNLEGINESFKAFSSKVIKRIQWFIEDNERVNKMVESIVSERNG